MATLEQQRAAYAWEHVEGCNKDYMNLAKGAPALIMNNGLMQALAFYQSKDKRHHLALNRHILGWLHQQSLVEETDFAQAMGSLHQAEPDAYRRATREALELLKWIRQFAAVVAGED
jgi:CRISPR-associated protein Cmr5